MPKILSSILLSSFKRREEIIENNEIKFGVSTPYFTTKPTGDGNTGLGLSLAYDIVTKGHGGTLEVVSVEGEGAEFIIRLPIG